MAFFKGIFSKITSGLTSGLAKTREVFSSGLRRLILGRKLDDALIADIERALINADVGPKATARLVDGLRADFKSGKLQKAEEVIDYLKTECKKMLGGHAPATLELATAPAPPTVILVTGINGAGKTTSIAKLASRLRSQGKTVMLAACDTFRAGAVRQLEVWAERLGVEMVKGQQGGDPAAVAFDACKAAVARGVDVLIVDTAGRLQTQDPLMRQLTKIRSVIAKQIPGAPHESLLVLDATTGQNALRQTEEFSKAMSAKPATDGGTPTAASGPATEPTTAGGITGIILAKLDGTAKGGIVLAIRSASAIPVKFVGVGERPEDLEPFDPDAFVEALFAE